MYLSFTLSIYLLPYVSIFYSIYLSFTLSIYLLLYLSIFYSIYLSFTLSIYLLLYLSIFYSIYLSFTLSIYLLLNLSIHYSTYIHFNLFYVYIYISFNKYIISWIYDSIHLIFNLLSIKVEKFLFMSLLWASNLSIILCFQLPLKVLTHEVNIAVNHIYHEM